MGKETIELLVEGGKASPGPTSAPRLSMLKVNIGEIFKEINEKTSEYKGMQVPVKIEIDTETKEYKILIGTPPVSSLIKKELGIEKAGYAKETASSEAKAKEKSSSKEEKAVLGDLKFEQVVKIAKLKMENLLAKDLKAAVKQILGTANSMTGILVEGKRPKEIIKEVDEGKWDNKLK
jgi:large subunit ribosomal protein L11